MKPRRFLLGLLLVAGPAGLRADRFHGGFHDGADAGLKQGYDRATADEWIGSRFHGGIRDGAGMGGSSGYSRATADEWVGSRFHGGMRDGAGMGGSSGYSRATADEWVGTRFLGGEKDGASSALRIDFNPDKPGVWVSVRFTGGGVDGHDAASRIGYRHSSSPQWTGRRFTGGVRDGFQLGGVYGIPSPAALDSDGDQLPDWWEILYYRSLAATDAAGDTDQDRIRALDEFLAGTDPSDEASGFRILSMQVEGENVLLSFSCAESRLYDLMSRREIDVGMWAPVPGHTNLPGSVTGVLSIQVRLDTNRVYKVDLHP